MERDPKLERVIRESGLEAPSAGFTDRVVDRISAEPERKTFKPLIGRWGRIIIIFLLTGIVLISIVYSEPSGLLQERGFNVPELNLEKLTIPDINFSTGLLAGLAALFILVLADLGIKRRLA